MNRRYYAPSSYSSTSSSKRPFNVAFPDWTQHISDAANYFAPHIRTVGDAAIAWSAHELARRIHPNYRNNHNMLTN